LAPPTKKPRSAQFGENLRGFNLLIYVITELIQAQHPEKLFSSINDILQALSVCKS